MKYIVTNPKSGAPISVGDVALAVGESKEFKQSTAEYLVNTFGFLTLEVKEAEVKKEKKDEKEKATKKKGK